MKDATSARKKSNLLYLFWYRPSYNFAVVKSLRKFGCCLVDNNTFALSKKVLSSLFLIS